MQDQLNLENDIKPEPEIRAEEPEIIVKNMDTG